ncbi:hypothetical protein RMATCC62417_03870 [Rhizopus microsporus]|nr:hypothetical protein RMATCC62417_03870 [Rhizopus microsporus]
MFDQQQQPQQQQKKPNFKFVIRSKIESTTSATSSNNEQDNKPIEIKKEITLEQPKRKRPATTTTDNTSVKKIHTQLERWNKKHLELKEEKEHEEQARVHYADLSSLTCILCQRKFKSKSDLERHQQLSELHKNNLNDPVAVNKAMLKLSFLKDDVDEQQEETKYRNRAAERRQAYGQPEKPILSPPSPPRHMHPPRDISISHVLQASMDKPISEDNKGAQMLLNMGWRKGEGLGKNRSGIVDPVKAQQYGQGSGIGHTHVKRVREP